MILRPRDARSSWWNMYSLEVLLAALVAGAAPAHAPAPAVKPPPAVAHGLLPLGGARLGLSLEAWRALPWPGAEGVGDADCAAPARTQAASPGGGAPSVLVCRRVHRYGAYSMADSLPLAGPYQARDPAFVFVDGRLSEVRFKTAADAFNLVTARVDKAYGKPAKIERDAVRLEAGAPAVPRVRMTWRNAAGSVVVTDPAADPNVLAVDLKAVGETASQPG